MTSRLLLDTHTFIWMVAEPERLSRQASKAVRDLSAEVLVSSVVPFEIATKFRLGKFPAGAIVLEGFRSRVDALRGTHLNVTAEHALLAGRMDWAHRDPFDRLLAAQAVLENATLVTADRAFGGLPGLQVLWD